MSRIILITFFISTVTIVHGQEFYDSLQSEAKQTHNCSFNFYYLDSLNHIFFGSGDVKMQIDSSAKYQILFYDSNSWCSGPNCFDHKIFLLDSLANDKEIPSRGDSTLFSIPRKKHYHCSKTYSGAELIKNTEIDFKDYVFTNFPTVKNNQDKYNGEWTVFSNEKYVVFRKVSVYIGNTSNVSEEYIYFKKVK